MNLTAQDKRFFKTFGFSSFRSFFSPDEFAELSREFDEAMTALRNLHSPTRRARFFMDADTPNIAILADDERLAGMAEKLLGRQVICIHVGGIYFKGSTQWHSDNLYSKYRGIKFAIYLDRLNASTGALRVIPGSHRNPMRNKCNLSHDTKSAFNVRPDQLPAVAIATEPGDVIAFEQRLWHASFHGGSARRMIEVNFYADPRTPTEISAFTHQMRLNHAAANSIGVKLYNDRWCTVGSERHLYWIERLRKLGVLKNNGID